MIETEKLKIQKAFEQQMFQMLDENEEIFEESIKTVLSKMFLISFMNKYSIFKKKKLSIYPFRKICETKIDIWNDNRYKSWIDHLEVFVDKDNKEVYVSHPYHLNMIDFKSLMQFCTDFNLQFRIEPNSWYNPTRTFAIVITKI